MAKQNLSLTLKTDQRLALIGRMRMAEWIEMPEGQFSQEISKLEKDPLFQKLYLGLPKTPGVIRRQKWPAGRLGQSFYALDERLASSAGSVNVDKMLQDKSELIKIIQKIGQDNFEKYFLYAEQAFTLEELTKHTALAADEIKKIHTLLNDIDVETQFASGAPGGPSPALKGYSCIGRIAFDNNEPYVEFNTSYWGRGIYQIRYEQLEHWKRNGFLNGDERKRVRHLIKKLETLNLRQNTIYRILESLAKLQSIYLKTRKESDWRPISLRLLAKRLQLAPSTISRATSSRSVRLPWGTEVPLAELMPGQRRTLKAILSGWLKEEGNETDSKLAGRLKQEYGISVSRRTVNAIRHDLA